LTFYLRTLDLDDAPFIAIPVFPARHFRHSAVFVNTSSGIDKPQDLAGKTIGEFAMYGTDAGVWPKGILSDDYGVTPDQCRWVIGGTNWPMAPFDFIPQLHPADVDVTPAPEGKALGPMLQAGEIDALISVDVPQCVLNGAPQIAPLFGDTEAVERDYFRRTGIFPIMHTIVVPKDLLARHPGLATTIYRGFCDAKDVAMQHYRNGMTKQQMDVMIPWFTPLFDKNRHLLGEDWWPYDVEANRETIDAFLRYHFEQGLSRTDRSSLPLIRASATPASRPVTQGVIRGLSAGELRTASKLRTNMALRNRSSSVASSPSRSTYPSTRSRPVVGSSRSGTIRCSYSVRMSSTSNASLVP
jgi:hypothetical protein